MDIEKETKKLRITKIIVYPVLLIIVFVLVTYGNNNFIFCNETQSQKKFSECLYDVFVSVNDYQACQYDLFAYTNITVGNCVLGNYTNEVIYYEKCCPAGNQIVFNFYNTHQNCWSLVNFNDAQYALQTPFSYTSTYFIDRYVYYNITKNVFSSHVDRNWYYNQYYSLNFYTSYYFAITVNFNNEYDVNVECKFDIQKYISNITSYYSLITIATQYLFTVWEDRIKQKKVRNDREMKPIADQDTPNTEKEPLLS